MKAHNQNVKVHKKTGEHCAGSYQVRTFHCLNFVQTVLPAPEFVPFGYKLP